MEEKRIQLLNDLPPDENGAYVLYWMQQSQRAEFNYALEYSISRANERGQGLVVCFGLTDSYPEANARHYAFMLEGLAETSKALDRRGIKFVMVKGEPDEVALKLASQASLVVCDRGYLRHQRDWRRNVAHMAEKQVIQVECDIVVPVEVASAKEEYAARTIRPKLKELLFDFLSKPETVKLKKNSTSLSLAENFEILDADQPGKLLKDLNIDHSVKPVASFAGGTSRAQKLLDDFLDFKLNGYATKRSDASNPHISLLSPYLHFGQISPVQIALAVREAKAGDEDRISYMDELIIQRELAINFVYYNKDYDSFKCLPDWAKKTLKAHERDLRPAIYTQEMLETAQTDDRYWNAAMSEMLKTGYMHNHMRMYWGKKILEWTESPEDAYRITLYLNNKYFLDGRDPNSFANVGWIFGLHDRAWFERPIFGKVRYMNANGLKRKFDIESYIQWVESIEY